MNLAQSRPLAGAPLGLDPGGGGREAAAPLIRISLVFPWPRKKGDYTTEWEPKHHTPSSLTKHRTPSSLTKRRNSPAPPKAASSLKGPLLPSSFATNRVIPSFEWNCDISCLTECLEFSGFFSPGMVSRGGHQPLFLSLHAKDEFSYHTTRTVNIH